MKYFVALFVMGILTENFVLSRFLGICPFLGVSKKLDTAVGMSVAVIFVMLFSTILTYPVNLILIKYDMAYLQTIVFILLIASLVQLLEIFLKRYIKALYNSLGIYLPLITTNCAVLGIVLLNAESDFSFAQAVVRTLGAGVGFLVAMVMFAGVRGRMEACDIPKSLRGLPITLIAASLVSLSFLGFVGIVEGMGLV